MAFVAAALAFTSAASASVCFASVSLPGKASAAPGAKSSHLGKSCFFYRGKKKWCLEPLDGFCADVDGPDNGGRYVVYEGNTRLGFIRRSSPGRWRAVYPAVKGWVRGGFVVRTGPREWAVWRGGRRLGFTRGPRALETGAYRLLAEGCF